jgi:hypothetical protein
MGSYRINEVKGPRKCVCQEGERNEEISFDGFNCTMH